MQGNDWGKILMIREKLPYLKDRLLLFALF